MEAQWRLRSQIPDLDEERLSQLRLFHVELLRMNQTLSLISTYTEKNADYLHFLDCLKACEFIYKENSKMQSLFDLGSGNGFPGVVFAILYPQVKVVLVESDERFADFLRHITTRLQLPNTNVVSTKVEELQIDGKTVAVCRAFSNLARTLLMGNKIFARESIIYSMRGSDWFSELASLPTQIGSTWNTEMSYEYELPESLGSRVILKSVKILD